MTDQPHVRRISYRDQSGEFRWFNADEAVGCYYDGIHCGGVATRILYEAPGGAWVLKVYGKEVARELTVDEALVWLSKHSLDPYKPWPERLRQLAEQRSAARAPAGGDAKEKHPSKLATALAILNLHPDWTNKQIAEQVPCNANWLSQEPIFLKARKTLKAGKAELPRGSKGDEGTMEAYES
jgi:hypothetical protein